MKASRMLMIGALWAPLLASAHDYPTMDRVDNVLTCMAENGGQNIDNLQRCSCQVDVLMQQVSFEEFTEARTYEIYKQMPGDKGGLFRDNDHISLRGVDRLREPLRAFLRQHGLLNGGAG